MATKRIPTQISFPSEEDRDAAFRKSEQRGRSLSGQIQWYFRQLPDLESGAGSELPDH